MIFRGETPYGPDVILFRQSEVNNFFFTLGEIYAVETLDSLNIEGPLW